MHATYPSIKTMDLTDQDPSCERENQSLSIPVVSAVTVANPPSDADPPASVGMIKKYKKETVHNLGGILYCFCPSCLSVRLSVCPCSIIHKFALVAESFVAFVNVVEHSRAQHSCDLLCVSVAMPVAMHGRWWR